MKRKRRLAESRVRKRSIVIAGRRTSLGLEDAFWLLLKKIAAQKGIPVNQLVTHIDMDRQHANLSSAIRLYLLEHYVKLTERRAGGDVKAK